MMKCRTLFQTIVSLATLTAAVFMTDGALAADAGPRQYYELRTYTTTSEQQQKLVCDYWKDAGVPAYNRMGVQPIGVFIGEKDSPSNSVYVLIPFDSLEAFAAVPARLAADSQYQEAAATFMAMPKSNPAYERIESSLNIAFESMKTLAVPPSAAEKKPWIFELRVYLSPSEGKGINKVQMFNSGEVPLMRECDLSPVFFSQTLIGPRMPNLVYMVSSANMEEHQKHWQAFKDAPIWKKLSSDPQYKDNVSRAISIFLKRAPASQI